MEDPEVTRRRKELAEFLRHGGKSSSYEPETCPENKEPPEEATGSYCVPTHISGNWYYAYPDMDEPMLIYFVNRCAMNRPECPESDSEEELQARENPLENYQGKIFVYHVYKDDSPRFFQVLKKSAIALDITEIKDSFLQASN